MHSHLTKQRFPSSQTLRETPRIWYAAAKMAGIRGKSGPPGNQNAFRHGLAGIAQRRADGVLNPAEQSIREEILSGLLADKVANSRSAWPCECSRRSSQATCRYW